MSVLNPSRTSAGAPAKTSFRASPARESRNRAAMWLAGTRVPTICIPSGMVPIGMYIPARNPIRTLTTTKNPENAPLLWKNEVIE